MTCCRTVKYPVLLVKNLGGEGFITYEVGRVLRVVEVFAGSFAMEVSFEAYVSCVAEHGVD